LNKFLTGIPILNKRVKFPVAPHYPGGFVTPEELRRIAAVAEKYGGQLKIIGGGITIMDLNLSDGEAAMSELGVPPESFIAKSVRAVAMCPGKPHCPMARQDSCALGLALDSEFFGQAAPAKVRIGVSGCPNCCAEVLVKDIGMFGEDRGFTLAVGGNAGRRARVGRVIASGVPGDQMRGIIDSILAYYRLHGKDKERLGDTLDRTGWDQFIETVIPQEYRLIGSGQ